MPWMWEQVSSHYTSGADWAKRAKGIKMSNMDVKNFIAIDKFLCKGTNNS